MKLIWHCYLVLSLNNCAHKTPTETDLSMNACQLFDLSICQLFDLSICMSPRHDREKDLDASSHMLAIS